MPNVGTHWLISGDQAATEFGGISYAAVRAAGVIDASIEVTSAFTKTLGLIRPGQNGDGTLGGYAGLLISPPAGFMRLEYSFGGSFGGTAHALPSVPFTARVTWNQATGQMDFYINGSHVDTFTVDSTNWGPHFQSSPWFGMYGSANGVGTIDAIYTADGAVSDHFIRSDTDDYYGLGFADTGQLWHYFPIDPPTVTTFFVVPPATTGHPVTADIVIDKYSLPLQMITCTVDWGDGSPLTHLTINDGTMPRPQSRTPTHVYLAPGTYTVIFHMDWTDDGANFSTGRTITQDITVTGPVIVPTLPSLPDESHVAEVRSEARLQPRLHIPREHA